MKTTSITTGYAVLVTSQTTELGYLRQQLVVADIERGVKVWSRVTNGGRGVSNAWTDSTYDSFTTNKFGNELIVGSVLSSPLTATDIQDVFTNNSAFNMIQKLTKQFALRDKTLTGQLLSDVVADVDTCLATDINSLVKFRSDGRADKTATVNYKPINIASAPIRTASVAPSAPVVVREDIPLEIKNKYVPSQSDPEVANYIQRTFDGIKEFDIFERALINKENVLLEGHAGTGKTTSAKAFASSKGLPFYAIGMNLASEPSDYKGQLEPQADGTLKFVYGELALAFKYGGVVLLDELSFIKEGCSADMHNALDKLRQITLRGNDNEVIQGHDELLIIGAYNAGYRGTRKLNEAFADRFTTQLVYEYDSTIEKKIIKSKSLLELANQMRAESVRGEYETPISLRLLKGFQYHVINYNFDFAVRCFTNHFNEEERASVKLLLEAYSTNIAEEYAVAINTPIVDNGADN